CLLSSYLFESLMSSVCFYLFFIMESSSSHIFTLSLHDALPILIGDRNPENVQTVAKIMNDAGFDAEAVQMDLSSRESIKNLIARSEEHTSELQSRFDLVCRLLLE